MSVDTRETGEERTSSQEEQAAPPAAPLEGSPRRRLVLSLFIGATLLAVLSSFLPVSAPGAVPIRTATGPYLLATGLDQTWGMFAPDPQRASTRVTAVVTRTDRSTVEYDVPSSRGLGAYWDYRWMKYSDQFSLKKEYLAERWAFVRWVFAEDRRAGGRPERVTLVLTSTPLRPPGPGPDSGPTRSTPFFTASIGSP